MLSSLPLLGEMPASSAPRRFTIAAKGFRSFFLLAATFAAVMLPLWMLALIGVFHPEGYLNPTYWHAHEMVFGFAGAVIAGFLLTAVGNWTSSETVVGAPLIGLCLLWLLGRLALAAASLFPRWVPAALDLAFLPALAAGIGRPIVASRKWQHTPMIAVLMALWLANLAIHLDALGVLPEWQRRGSLVAVDIVVVVMLVMAGRVFPMFTRNATGVSGIRSIPVLDALATASMAVLAILDAAALDPGLTAYVAGAASLFSAARSVHWGARQSFGVPLLWILHVGYAWIPIGLALRTVSAFDGRVPPILGTHALTIGAIGGLTLGMMSRVALGHTGRALAAPRPLVCSFALVTLAALVRVGVPLFTVSFYQASIFVSGTLWTAAFCLFIVVFFPILVSPRLDAKPG